MAYVLRARFQTIDGKPMATLWLLKQMGGMGREGRMFGDMRPESAEKIIALFEAAGVPVERDAPTPGTDAMVGLPHDTVEAQIAATSAQGSLF